MNKWILVTFIAAAPIASAEIDRNAYDFCQVGGYLYAKGHTFTGSLASRVVILGERLSPSEGSIFGGPECNAAWKEGHDAAKREFNSEVRHPPMRPEGILGIPLQAA